MPFQSLVAFSSAGFILDELGRKDNAWMGGFLRFACSGLLYFVLFFFSIAAFSFCFKVAKYCILHFLFFYCVSSAIKKNTHTIYIHRSYKHTLLDY